MKTETKQLTEQARPRTAGVRRHLPPDADVYLVEVRYVIGVVARDRREAELAAYYGTRGDDPVSYDARVVPTMGELPKEFHGCLPYGERDLLDEIGEVTLDTILRESAA